MNSTSITTMLPPGLPVPVTEPDNLSAPYWKGLEAGRLLVQKCKSCDTWQWGPEWICHSCLSFEIEWEQIEPAGRIYVAQRVWHPVHPVLKGATPYVIVLVELPHAGGIRMIGNLLGNPMDEVVVGDQVRGEFEHHTDGSPAYTLLNWRRN